LKLLESSYEVEEDPYGTVNLLDLIRKTNEKEKITSLSELSKYSPLNIRIEAIKVYPEEIGCAS
jgi:hypothetical protein